MPIAPTSRTRVAYIAESAFGTTPSTPTFLEIRRTSGNLRTRKTTAVSEEIRLDRNVRAEYQLAQDVEGSYDFELTYGSYDDILEAAVGGAWNTNVLVNGSVEKSLTFEETIDVGGGSFAYHRFTGVEVDSLSLNFTARRGVTGSVTLQGKQEALDTAIISGATYTAPNTNVIETANSVASLAVASLSPVPIVRSLSLNIANNLRRHEVLGSLYTNSFGSGQLDVTGTLEAYFTSNALYQAVLDHGTGALALTIGSVTAKKYTISLPVIQFLDGAKRLGGKNDDVMVSIPFRAVADSAPKSISITRAVA
ncbi:MAG: hypothetical protein KGZ68_15020 [Dechloromonas sp.]|nr:hypothetical protein [Dechloromonas sp.]